MKLFELVRPRLAIYTGFQQWKAAVQRYGAKPEIEPHQNKRTHQVIGARKNSQDVGVWVEKEGFHGGIVFKTPEEFAAWNKQKHGNLEANLKHALQIVTIHSESLVESNREWNKTQLPLKTKVKTPAGEGEFIEYLGDDEDRPYLVKITSTGDEIAYKLYNLKLH